MNPAASRTEPSTAASLRSKVSFFTATTPVLDAFFLRGRSSLGAGPASRAALAQLAGPTRSVTTSDEKSTDAEVPGPRILRGEEIPGSCAYQRFWAGYAGVS